MAYEHIRVEREGTLTIVTIDRPQAYNALHLAAHRELAAAFDVFAADDDQWIAIITGSGKAFCAGHDLKQQAKGGGMETSPTGFAGLTGRFDMTKPVIAAVNGVALGGGFELALACDLIIASEKATFALPETKVGLAALGGALQRLPREIGLKRAMSLLLTGRRVTAREGLDMGFVNEVAEDALIGARRLADDLLTCSPMSLRATKEAVSRGLFTDTATGLREQWTYPAMAAMLASEDAIEGPAAFVAKREPRWTGR